MSVSSVSNITPVDPKREMQAIQQPPAVRNGDPDGDKDKGPAPAHAPLPQPSHRKVDIRA